MSATPLFVGTPLQYAVTVQSAESNRTTPTKYGSLISTSSNDISVPAIAYKALVAATIQNLFFFLYDGVTNYLLHEETTTTANPTQSTVASYEGQYVPDLPILVPAGWALRVAVSENNAFNFMTVNAGKF